MDTEDNTKKPVEPEDDAAQQPAAEQEAPSWEYKTDFNITGLTRELISKTIDATNAEIESLRRRLEKLTYGG